MSTTDVLAIIGAVTGIIGTIAGLGALGWDVYKWRYSERVQLKVTATPGFVTTTNPKEEMIMVSVTNIGKVPTTLKLLSLQFLHLWKSISLVGAERPFREVSQKPFLFNEPFKQS